MERSRTDEIGVRTLCDSSRYWCSHQRLQWDSCHIYYHMGYFAYPYRNIINIPTLQAGRFDVIFLKFTELVRFDWYWVNVILWMAEIQ